MWWMKQLHIEGNFQFFKTLAISKIVHLALIKETPSTTSTEQNTKRIYLESTEVLR